MPMPIKLRALKNVLQCIGRIHTQLPWAHFQTACKGSLSRYHSTATTSPHTITVNNRIFEVDEWTNIPSSILEFLPRKLHLQPSHPISLTRQVIEAGFPGPTYTHYNDLDPVVTVHENFDSLGFPENHPGRDKTDTYYINKNTVLRTHTSAHEAEIFRRNNTGGYTISADVYRRDAIDRSHYPVFHQMEGARIWNREKVPKGDVVRAVYEDYRLLNQHNFIVEDTHPTIHPERNPLQSRYHSVEEVEALTAHLKRSLELMIVDLFTRASKYAGAALKDPVEAEAQSRTIKLRWVEAYFPFTSPSWELEVFWQGDWLEVLGCGVTKQEIQINAGMPNQIGWAFGVGLERLAMLLFSIPDIRLFWSRDHRFLEQFSSIGDLKPFVPFSKYPACYKDVSFWLRGVGGAAGGAVRASKGDFHENDFMEIVRDVGGDLVEDVKLIDEFTHKVTSRKSLCYRINYRSLERTLKNEEADQLHQNIRNQLVEKFGVELR